MKFKIIPIEQLREHPQNHKYFSDIKKTSKNFWEEFKTNIKKVGIIEALVVNEDTMEVISGNQRLKAAREIELKTVPCVLCKATDPEAEIRKMISANTMRRELDPITLFEYIGILRAGYDGKPGPGEDRSSQEGSLSWIDTQKKTGKGNEFISAADIYKNLSEEQQKELREWFYEQDGRPTDKDLIAKIKDLEHERLVAGKTVEQLQLDIQHTELALEAMKKVRKESGEKNAEELKKLRGELRTLKEAAKQDRQIEAFRKALINTEKALSSASAEIADLLERAERLGKGTELRGIARPKLIQEMNDLISSLKRLRNLAPREIGDNR